MVGGSNNVYPFINCTNINVYGLDSVCQMKYCCIECLRWKESDYDGVTTTAEGELICLECAILLNKQNHQQDNANDKYDRAMGVL